MLKIACSEADITPSLPIDLSGFALRKNPSDAVIDPLKVRWLSLQDEEGGSALVGAADVLSYSRETFKVMRDKIRGDFSGINIGLATSHTHSGPATVRLRHCGRMKKDYLAHMKQQVVTSARSALEAPLQKVELRVGTALFDANINRRKGESGPVDREVLTLSFNEASSGKTLATLVNYACHPVTLGHENVGISADFPGYLCASIEERTGGSCLFLNGACGDVNPRIAHEMNPAVPEQMGYQLAAAALRSLESATPINAKHIGWHRQKVELPVRVPKSIRDVEKRLDTLQESFGLARELFADRLAKDRKSLADQTYPRKVSIELSLLTFGDDLGTMFVPGEIFSSIGLRAKQLARPGRLLISGFSNGSVGYLCDREAFAEGGYEPNFANFFYDYPEFEPSLEDAVLEGMKKLILRGGLSI